MIAAIHQKIATRVGKLAFFYVFDPGAVHANGHIMFSFTRYRAGVTADTFTLVNNEGVFHKIMLSLPLLPYHIASFAKLQTTLSYSQCTEEETRCPEDVAPNHSLQTAWSFVGTSFSASENVGRLE
ncbi:MAG TPA: hypothetical protein VKY19_13580 [Ktedonosporobacter sp.]|nr:hypothetical protein [Ktedonosporobacter sp.]